MSEPKQVKCLRPNGSMVYVPEHLVGKMAFRVQGLQVIPESEPNVVRTPVNEEQVVDTNTEKRGPGRPRKNEND